MRLSRLIQPRNPLFWLLLMLNLLSVAISHLLQTRELPVLLRGGLGVFALANLLLGMWIGWRLMADKGSITHPQPATAEEPCSGASSNRH